MFTSNPNTISMIMNKKGHKNSYVLYFRKNFLQVDIFYKEMAERIVSQQKAYEYAALLGKCINIVFSFLFIWIYLIKT